MNLCHCRLTQHATRRAFSQQSVCARLCQDASKGGFILIRPPSRLHCRRDPIWPHQFIFSIRTFIFLDCLWLPYRQFRNATTIGQTHRHLWSPRRSDFCSDLFHNRHAHLWSGSDRQHHDPWPRCGWRRRWLLEYSGRVCSIRSRPA